MEPFYSFDREVDLGRAGDQRRIVEIALEIGRLDDVTADVRAAVQGYNDDDCQSTLELRDWLEELRRGVIASGVDVARPVPKSGEGTDKVKERDRRAVSSSAPRCWNGSSRAAGGRAAVHDPSTRRAVLARSSGRLAPSRRARRIRGVSPLADQA